ncbi:LuxR family transcriptional regulator [Salinibacterium hongtaonis]|uniref:LuxR family transcriptional regulator n=1 Tax=Homoserinimonas hongtaonis TaxID=2079791 RepID=A0A2U1SXX2_9MICO|nr:LuxR family transcriptional regulator [Salinibacterium hongtaonis]
MGFICRFLCALVRRFSRALVPYRQARTAAQPFASVVDPSVTPVRTQHNRIVSIVRIGDNCVVACNRALKGATVADLLDRGVEVGAVERLLSHARAGRSSTLVVRGEAGIGKTALLDLGRDSAQSSGFRVESSTGVEAESQFAFAGLHQLCAPLFDRADALPDPQRSALDVAFGRRGGAAPDRFLVGLAALNLLAEVSEERPLLCLVDDAQWLDEASAQVLAFVARRLSAERIALLFAVRDSREGHTDPFAGLPELRLDGLSSTAAQVLLDGAVRTPLDAGVCERIIAEARGNPLALMELPLSLPTTQLAGGFELPGVASIPRRIEESFQRRSSGLPRATQLLVLLAAAEPTGDTALLRRAAECLKIAPEAAEPAEAAGLLEIGTRVRFRHPLVRSAVYQASAPADRRRVHAALAAATDPETNADRRAWHRAQAVLGTDEEAAAELEHSASRALARGGVAAAAAFLHRAADLTPRPADRARRALHAAEAKHEAGASEAALALLAVADDGPLDPLQRARLELLRAQIAFHLRGSDAPRMLLDAAQLLASLDPALSRETYLHAVDAAIIMGGHDVVRVAQAALAAPPAEVPSRPVDLILDALTTTLVSGYGAGVPWLRRALEAFCDGELTEPRPDNQRDPWLRLAGRNAMAILDDDLLYVLANRNVQLARESGALAALPDALRFLSVTCTLMGELTRAGELATEATAISEATGGVQLLHARVILSAWRGDQAQTAELSGITAQNVDHPDDGAEAALSQYALAVLHNGLGNYSSAQEAATRARASQELSLSSAALTLPEYIEACVRNGQMEHALKAMQELAMRANASGTSWALGLAARSRALISSGAAADLHYREAIDHLRLCRMATQLARAHLVYGEWLRREGRRQDAREQLRTAHDLLSEMGAEAFAARAGRELSATGEHPRKRASQRRDELTSQELHIVRLVAAGATSREVGTQLFLSPRTVEAHLRNIFRKLGINSRRQLREI